MRLLHFGKKGPVPIKFLLFTLFGVIISNSYADISDDLFQAAFEGNTSKIEKLIKKGADVNAKDENGAPVLMAAAANGQTEIVKMLLDKGADVNVKDKDGKTALMYAADRGHTDIVKLLRK